ncbi:hypothetical protein VaNZ11_011570 [Volvox africanus]|uniref:Protein kinase domain-containing protein n=1 Tax=Volvox africanus TaxID=51714 RepID=A0ABQ5SDH8_9CHLO|nr:hypothetical protein VaNZ11_011570 [Volvox africanus]
MGNVFVVGNGTSTWDVSASPLSFADNSSVTVSCLRILLEQPGPEVTQPLPINYMTLLSPSFIRRSSKTQLFALTIRDVEISLSCAALLEWQHYLCGVQLPGRTLVHGNTISILSWMGNRTLLEHVNMTCEPGTAGFSPACSMAVVDVVSDILDASSRLQDPYLPLVLTVSRDLSFTDSHWPDNGLRITANVTLSATLGSNVTISFGLRTVLFTVDKNSSRTAFLSFRGCILVDLPLSYLPLNHPRRPFGVLSTALWPVYREEVAMGLYNCTLILTQEEFKFWSYWLSILVSPIPGVSVMGNWTFANDVQLGKSGIDYIHLVNYMGRYTTLMNVRYQVSNDVYVTQQRNNILQITNNEVVPPTVVFQARDSDDLLTALSSPSATAAQHGQYIILTGSVTTLDDTIWPVTGAPIWQPTIITTWPSSWVALDLRLIKDAFVIMPSSLSSVLIKNVVLLNLCAGDSVDEFAGLTTGLWAFKFTNWRNTEQQRISLDRAVVVVSREEVGYYIDATVNQQKTDAWISSFQVDSYDTTNRSWVKFATLATARFSAQSVNITNTIPDTLDSDSINLTIVQGFPWNSRVTEQPSEKKRDMLMFALLVITLPTALGAALLTFLLMKRRRISRLCREGVSQRKLAERHDDDGEEDVSDGEEHEGETPRKQEPPVCCFPLSFQLRKSKFVNPLFADAGRAPAEIVLTGVLGPVALARSLVPVPPEASMLATNASTSTAAGSDLEFDGIAATGPELLIKQAMTENASAGTRSGGGSQALGVLIAVPTELRRGAEVAGDLAAAVTGSGVSPLSGSCLSGSGPQLEHKQRSSCCPQLASADGPYVAAAAAAAQSAPGNCGVIAGSPHDRLSSDGGGVGSSSPQEDEFRLSPAAAAAVLATGQAAASGCGEDANAYTQRQGLLGGTREASQGASRNPRFLDMQQLDRLRHEIGDRHLEVQHSLGWGGCGVVYKGVWKGLQVAVKTILLQGDSKQSQQILTEAAISASLQHANIVTTYLYELRPLDEVVPGTGNMEIQLRSTSSDGVQPQDWEHMGCWKLYIVQEYCELGTLKAAIDQGYFKSLAGGSPNLAFMLTVALDMALGLEHVHSKNVVHGDVTVSNVLLQACPSRPQGCIAKVADFGLSVKFDTSQTHGYHLYGGTPHYMAPERVRGVLSKRSDIYSLGVCFWELYCGTPPWRRNAAGAHHRGYGGGTTSSSVDSGGHHNQHLHPSFGDSAPGTSLSDSFRFPRGCPPEYSTLVHACLSVDPQARPTATTVASTLQRLHRRYC